MEPTKKIHIGDVLVCRSSPPPPSPYGGSLIGDERVAALRAYRDGSDTRDYTFWRGPVGGGCRRLTGPGEVDWTGLRG